MYVEGISFIPRGAGFFGGTWGRYLGLRRCVYRCSEQHPAPTSTCPCEYVARRPPHRRWVQETQPHTYGCAERILTAEFQKLGSIIDMATAIHVQVVEMLVDQVVLVDRNAVYVSGEGERE